MKKAIWLLALGAGVAAAQSKEGFAYFPATKLKGYAATLKGAMGSEQLGNRGNHSFMVARREQSGEPEVHMAWSDIHIPQDGEATIVWGGKVEGGRETQPGEIRGGKIVGGTSQKVRAGDVVVIPAGMPHQTVVEPGKPVTVLIIKVEKK
jgi:mannose-6-phosphate isomerase-like protein (cupin superfamily)